MSVYIHHIDTEVPETSYKQEFIRDLMKANVSTKRGVQSIIHRVYNNSGIDQRHSVITDFNLNSYPPLFFESNGKALPAARTKARNDTYIRKAKPLFSHVAEKTIKNCQGIEKEDITHLITVSCTGFFAPGPDFHIVKELGLDPSTQRYHIGFMGCYAAFPAIKMAAAFCEADPDAVVLIVCLELCTLHLQLREELDFIISASVFADGAASLLISARQPHENSQSLIIKQLGSDITPNGEDDMAWTIGDFGFDMTLSTYVPDIIKSNIGQIISNQLNSANLDKGNIDYWAIHPGGRAILDKIQQSMELSDVQVASSRKTLKEYGNMSSATILFVLKDVIENSVNKKDKNVMAIAFGPGLTIETGLFELSPSLNPKRSIHQNDTARSVIS
ncbi:MAG: type III polyketide synthase [Balneolales bacterium]